MTNDPITDLASGVVYTPWTDGCAVGFRCAHPGGKVEFIYLNPSQDSDDGVPTVFVYQGVEGDPNQDGACHHYIIDMTG